MTGLVVENGGILTVRCQSPLSWGLRRFAYCSFGAIAETAPGDAVAHNPLLAGAFLMTCGLAFITAATPCVNPLLAGAFLMTKD